MGRIKSRKVTKNAEKERRIQLAIADIRKGKYSSIRQTVEAHDVAFSTLRRRLNSGMTCSLAHATQQLLTVAEEKAVVRWILCMEGFGFPLRISHVKEAVVLLKSPQWPKDE